MAQDERNVQEEEGEEEEEVTGIYERLLLLSTLPQRPVDDGKWKMEDGGR